MYLFFLFVGCFVVSFILIFIIIFIEIFVIFKVVVVFYFDEVLEFRWLSVIGIIDISNLKFIGSKNILFLELVINNVIFEDDGFYEF